METIAAVLSTELNWMADHPVAVALAAVVVGLSSLYAGWRLAR